MKKLVVALLAALGMLIGTGLSASATDGYPPGATVAFTGPAGPVPAGSPVTLKLANAKPGSTVTFKINGQSQNVTVQANGVATWTIAAPANPNTYSASAVYNGTTYGKVDVVVVAAATTTTTTSTTVKPTGTVPATGSNTPFAGAALGAPILLGGLVLLGVSRRRRVVAA